MEPIRSGLRRVMGDFLKTQPQEEAALLAWPVVCGREVAARTRAVDLVDGCLTIEVPDTIWRTQLASFTPRYIAGLNDLLPDVVKKLTFTVNKPVR